ncbi:hypothetical protein [Nocardia asiatica]|uniref:hypothetical protein n=1 Tax=Nocardia asiatica TaxID=209252 RepID=UPI003EE36AAD
MAQTIAVDRDGWLGFLWQGQGLGSAVRAAALDDLLLLGVQGGRGGGPEQSLIQRTATVSATPVAAAVRPDGPLVTIWSMRGAPHAHPLSAVDSVCEGVAPVALAAYFRANGPATRLQLRDWLGSDLTAVWQQVVKSPSPVSSDRPRGSGRPPNAVPR